MRTSSRWYALSRSLMSLLSSNTAAGSMYTVWPVADSSWISPFTRRLCSAMTGSTNRPPRMVGSAPAGTQPSVMA